MAIGAFGRGRTEEGSGAATAAAGRGEGLTAFIDQGSEFDGTLRVQDTVRIEGDFKGEIHCENTVVVGESGGVQASIRSRNVIISGGVVGDVVATRQLILHKTARLHGNVETPSLQIEQGALFNGQMKMVRPEELARAANEPREGVQPATAARAPRWQKAAEAPGGGYARA